jgi:hypothetical protein|nr:MAG TPA: hypothetical protein [Caudoviricetes sp.]
MIIPKYNGRIMKEVKKYPNFILFEDPKTKVKKCFTYEELQREYEKPKERRVYEKASTKKEI